MFSTLFTNPVFGASTSKLSSPEDQFPIKPDVLTDLTILSGLSENKIDLETSFNCREYVVVRIITLSIIYFLIFLSFHFLPLEKYNFVLNIFKRAFDYYGKGTSY